MAFDMMEINDPKNDKPEKERIFESGSFGKTYQLTSKY